MVWQPQVQSHVTQWPWPQLHAWDLVGIVCTCRLAWRNILGVQMLAQKSYMCWWLMDDLKNCCTYPMSIADSGIISCWCTRYRNPWNQLVNMINNSYLSHISIYFIHTLMSVSHVVMIRKHAWHWFTSVRRSRDWMCCCNETLRQTPSSWLAKSLLGLIGVEVSYKIHILIYVDSFNGLRNPVQSSLSAWPACYFLSFKFWCYFTDRFKQFRH